MKKMFFFVSVLSVFSSIVCMYPQEPENPLYKQFGKPKRLLLLCSNNQWREHELMTLEPNNPRQPSGKLKSKSPLQRQPSSKKEYLDRKYAEFEKNKLIEKKSFEKKSYMKKLFH